MIAVNKRLDPTPVEEFVEAEKVVDMLEAIRSPYPIREMTA